MTPVPGYSVHQQKDVFLSLPALQTFPGLCKPSSALSVSHNVMLTRGTQGCEAPHHPCACHGAVPSTISLGQHKPCLPGLHSLFKDRHTPNPLSPQQSERSLGVPCTCSTGHRQNSQICYSQSFPVTPQDQGQRLEKKQVDGSIGNKGLHMTHILVLLTSVFPRGRWWSVPMS